MKKSFLTILACTAALSLIPVAAPRVTASAAENTARAKSKTNGWYKSSNGSTYYYKNGKKAKGLTKIGSRYYYFNTKTGARRSGLIKLKGKTYFFSTKTGARLKGFVTYKGSTYYFGRKGYSVTSHQRINGKRYFFNSKGVMLKNQWLAKKYYYGPDGVRCTGWQNIEGKNYYFDPSTGLLQTGWLNIDGIQHYLNEDGTAASLSGLQKAGSKYFYYDEESGAMINGWKTIDENTYYFSKINGAAVVGWRKIDGKYYYFNSRGHLCTNGWIRSKYYVGEDGARQFGWLTLKDKTYYLDPVTGARTVGWRPIELYRYYFDEKGRMITDTWVEDHYLLDDGRMAKNMWIGPNFVNKYGIKTSLTREPGLFTDDDKTYYLDENFANVKGWVENDGKFYYFDPITDEMTVNTWVDGHYLGEDGVRVTDCLLTIDDETYLFYEDGTKAAGMITYEEKTYYFSMTTGAMETGLKVVGEDTYYFDEELGGAMVVNDERYIDNSYYKFGEDGRLFSQENIGADEELGKTIAEYALKFVGNPYAYGGTSLTNGADCSGFTLAVFKHFDIKLPHNAAAQYTAMGGQKIPASALMPGDLVFYYKPIGHVAIYVGDIDDDGVGEVVHASNPSTGIRISDYDYTVITGCARFW